MSSDREHFKAFGYVTWRGLLDADEVAAIEAELMTVMTEAHAAKPFDGTARHWLPMLNAKSPVIAALAEDPRFYAKAKELVDDDVVLMVADANRYVSETGWHPDGKPGVRGVKFFIYLGQLGPGTGALRVIPGSHRDPLHSEIGGFIVATGAGTEELPAFVFECEPGDVLAFEYPMWHASKGGTTDRRMCTIEYYKAPSSDEEEKRIRDHLRLIVDVTAEAFPDPGGFPFYDPAWVAGAADDPMRAEIVDGMRRAGLFEIAGVQAPVG